MAISDIYDALTSDRAYRSAMSQEKAVSILREEAAAGKLDTDLVEMFIADVLADQPQPEPQPQAEPEAVATPG